MSEENSVSGQRSARPRSPNYPNYNLETCVKRASKLFDGYQSHFIPVEAAASVFKLSPKSSSFGKSIGALNQFNLIVDKGRGKDRQIQLSDLALDILDPGGDESRKVESLKKAALSPPIYAELWEMYDGNLPKLNDPIRYYLTRTREDSKFSVSAVESFITVFRESIGYANLPSGDKIPNNETEDEQPDAIGVGDYVQWESQGKFQFNVPRKVMKKSEDNQWIFVDGAKTAVPMSEVIKQDEPEMQPPVNPYAMVDRLAATPKEGVAKNLLTLDEGALTLEYPDELSAESVQDVEDWFEVIIRRMRRKAGLSPRSKEDL